MTDATSEIKAGEMCTGLVDPDNAPVDIEEPLMPYFERGRYGYHCKVARYRLSRHQRLSRASRKTDLMTEIMVELAKHPQRYRQDRLPGVLRGHFGVPTRIHRKAWLQFKSKYDQVSREC